MIKKETEREAREIVAACRHIGYESRGEWWSYGGACSACIAAALAGRRGPGPTVGALLDALTPDEASRIAYVLERQPPTLWSEVAVAALLKYAQLGWNARGSTPVGGTPRPSGASDAGPLSGDESARATGTDAERSARR